MTASESRRWSHRLGRWLHLTLEQEGWSDRRAGREVGVTHQTLAGIINGTTREVHSTTLEKLGRRFGQDPLTLARWFREPPDDAPTEPIGSAATATLINDIDDAIALLARVKAKLAAEARDMLERGNDPPDGVAS